MTGVPPIVLADPFVFAAYLRDLFDLFSDTPHWDLDGMPPKNAYIAGRAMGIAEVLALLDPDDHWRLVERVETVFADQIALHAEGYRAT